jgi:hypothetical protein
LSGRREQVSHRDLDSGCNPIRVECLTDPASGCLEPDARRQLYRRGDGLRPSAKLGERRVFRQGR